MNKTKVKYTSILTRLLSIAVIAIDVIRIKGCRYLFWFGYQMFLGFLMNHFGWHWFCTTNRFCESHPLFANRTRFLGGKAKTTFNFQGKEYNYFYHQHNATWRNERAVEIPIIWELLKEHKNKKILEVGNVLLHYFQIEHDILDKCENHPNVINQDVIDYKSQKLYDLIVSISTLEHVGWFWYDRPCNWMKSKLAIENLTKALAPLGKLIITIPIGYNFRLEQLIKEKKVKFDEVYYLKRISKNNQWIETDYENIMDCEYGKPFPGANAVLIGVIINKSST